LNLADKELYMTIFFKSTVDKMVVFFENSRRWPSIKECLFLLAITFMGLVGNYMSVELFFGVSFLFGSIATMIAVRMSGALWGTLVGIVVGSYSYILWGHPYAIIIFGLEAFVVGFITCGLKKENMILADIWYWAFVGSPLAFVFCTYQLGLPEPAVILLALKQIANGILNVVLASFIIQFTPIVRRIGLKGFVGAQHKFSMYSGINTLLSICILLPMIAATIISARAELQEVQHELNITVKEKVKDVGRELTSTLIYYTTILASTVEAKNNNVELWKSTINDLGKNVIPGLLNTEILSADGEILFSHPEQRSGISEYANQTFSIPFNSHYLSSFHSDYPLNNVHFTILKPISEGRFLAVYFSSNVFAELLISLALKGEYIELSDAQGIVIASSNKKDLSKFIQGINAHHLLPPNAELPSMVRWRQAYWESTESFNADNNWIIRVAAPMEESIEFLEKDYIQKLATMLMISLTALLLVPLLSRHFSMPLSGLTQAAGMFTDSIDRTDVAWPISNIDEVHSLVNQFQVLIQAINTKQSELSKSETQYSGIVETANDAIISIDENHDINLFNSGAEKIFGYGSDEIIGKSITKLMPDKFLNYREKSVDKFLDKSKNLRKINERLGIQGMRKNGEEFAASATISKFFIEDKKTFTIILQDISEHEIIVQENMRIAKDMIHLVDTANAPIFGIDAQGRVNEWNQQSEKITGFTKAEVMGRDLVADFITDDYKLSVGEVLAKALTGEQTANYEFPLYTKSGERVDVLLNSTTRRDARGQISGVVGVGQNITELNKVRMEQEVERKKANAQIIQASKLATLGEMSTSVAHELNQPLNVIRMAAGNSRRKINKGTADFEYINHKLERIEEQTIRAAAIIDHMRMFGREAKENLEPVDPRAIVVNALGFMGEQLRLDGIKIVSNFAEGCSSVLGHSIQMEQVILNLLANARDAMAESEDEKKITLGVFENESNVYITVDDSGEGIPVDVLSRIFEPFYTTKEVGKGTGLGLSVSYGIVCEMNGTIVAENIEGGARFTITLASVGEQSIREA
jgi:PAS domain S-box-containing protein